MNRLPSFPFLFVPLLACLLSPAPALAKSCVTAACHPDLAKAEVAHPPAADGECLACHEQENPKHPLTKGRSFVLAAAGSELCFQCHDDMGKDFAAASVIHPAIKEAGCTVCHDPHGSRQKALLKKRLPDLCVECHGDIGEKASRSRVRHAALYRSEKCATCHSPHFSRNPSLLLFPQKELCLSCHGEDDYTRSDPLSNIAREINGKKHLHGPVGDGECSACHDPHGSDFFRLLRGEYPADPYAPYRRGAYDFCFGCHNPDLLKSPTTTSGTVFRNGDENLHYLHVADIRKGRTCRMCHEPHASNNPKLAREDGSKFGVWRIPVHFKATETGGSCAPGCHRPLKYDRKIPVTYEAGED